MIYFIIATKFETGNLLSSSKKIDDSLYQLSSNQCIFISGMGEEVKKSINYFNKKYSKNATAIINIGIAGAIDTNLIKHSCHEVGTLQYKNQSYQLRQGKKLGTFTKPVWNKKLREQAIIQNLQLVDMEAFFIYETLIDKEKFRAIKFISDFCHKKNAQDFKNDAKITIKEIEKFITKFK